MCLIVSGTGSLGLKGRRMVLVAWCDLQVDCLLSPVSTSRVELNSASGNRALFPFYV